MPPLDRRDFLISTLAMGAGLATASRVGAQNISADAPLMEGCSDLSIRLQRLPEPIYAEAIELFRTRQGMFVRARSRDGVEGVCIANSCAAFLYPILNELVAPWFLNKDLRGLEALLDGVYAHQSNYKLSGLALWSPVGIVESALLDMIGKTVGRPVWDLLGPWRRKSVPVYLSSMRRDTTAEQEVEWLARRLEHTGANAAKIKVGGRMSANRDAAPGRTETLIPLMRRTLGDRVVLYADANGSYDAEKGIEVGRLLLEQRFDFFEEPCPFEEYDWTRQVTEALSIAVAGGEQDTRFSDFRRMVEDRIVDIVQPDLHYNGGFLRTLRVARLAEANGMRVTVHSSKHGLESVFMLHFAAVVPNIGPFQEYNGAPHETADWHEPAFAVRDGSLSIPDGPGLGVTYDSALFQNGQKM